MPLLTVVNKMFTPLGGGPLPGTIGTPATSATQMKNAGVSTNGVYWYKPTGAATAFQAYTDFTSPNGPWVNVGTAVGGTIGVWSSPSTWKNRTTDFGTFTDPTATGASSFNAGAFMYCKGNNIMLKQGGGNSGAGGSISYSQASGFSNESWRDVYDAAITTLSSWPGQPSYYRQLTITSRSAGMSANDLLYGTSWNDTGSSAYYYVWAFDTGGDTMAHLSTARNSAGDTGAYGEADVGIGANEYGPADQGATGGTPASPRQDATATFDAGCNGAYAQGWSGQPVSLWINN